MRILKKILKWVGIVIGGLLVLSIIVNTVLNIVWGRELRTKLAELKEKGEPTTIAEIRPKPVQDKENAALIYDEIFALKRILEARYSKEWEYMPLEGRIDYDKLSLEQKKTTSDLIFHNPDFIRLYQLIEEAAKMPYCQFDVDYEKGFLMSLSHLAKMRGVTRMIGAKILLKADQGDIEGALETAHIGLKTVHGLRNEAILVSQLVRIACVNIILKNIQVVIGDNISSGKMENVILELENHLGSEPFKKCMDIERVFLRGEFNELINRRNSIKKLESFFEESSNELSLKLGYPEPAFHLNSLLKKDFVCCLTFLSEIKKTYDIPYPESVAVGKNLELNLKIGISRYFFLANSFLPVFFTKVREQMSLHEAKIQVCRIALALKIYKAKYETYPESLAKLVPDILEQIPSDPFTNRNLVYKKTKEGFILYSLGPNMKDDGGIPRFGWTKIAKTEAQRKAETNYDIVWKCEK